MTAYELAQRDLKQARYRAEELLWRAQLGFWPHSVRLSFYDMCDIAQRLPEPERSRWMRSMAYALQFPACVFYRTGGGDDWVGCRYGVEGNEYLSGWGRAPKEEGKSCN